MGKKAAKKVKKKCCGKYLKSGKHCKSCPLFVAEGTAADGGVCSLKKADKKKVAKKKAGKKVDKKKVIKKKVEKKKKNKTEKKEKKGNKK